MRGCPELDTPSPLVSPPTVDIYGNIEHGRRRHRLAFPGGLQALQLIELGVNARLIRLSFENTSPRREPSRNAKARFTDSAFSSSLEAFSDVRSRITQLSCRQHESL